MSTPEMAVVSLTIRRALGPLLDGVVAELSQAHARQRELEERRDSIIYLMNMLGVQQNDIAKRAGMTPPNVRKILSKEEDRNPDSAATRRILEEVAEELRGRL